MVIRYQVTASAFASAGVGNDPQLSLSSQIPPLTTIFTPPSPCKTPFAFDGDCRNEFECDGSYMPFLYVSASGNQGGTSLQCYPEVTTYNGFVDAAFDYSPGLFCPDGMTTATSIASVFLCCPSGLTYSYDGEQDQCTATITMAEALLGSWSDNQATVLSITSFSRADSMTLYASAVPVYLTDTRSGTFGNVPSQAIPPVSGESSTTGPSTSVEVSSNTPTSNGPRCRRDGCQTTTTTTQPSTGGGSTPATNPVSSNESNPPNQINLKVSVGVGIGVAVAFVLLLALGYMLLRRYRQKRLLSRLQLLGSPPTKPDWGGEQAVRQIYQKKLPPELPVVESWVELEGTQVEDRGTGIYVWKPELEGTAGIPGAKGVYVRKKSELEAK